MEVENMLEKIADKFSVEEGEYFNKYIESSKMKIGLGQEGKECLYNRHFWFNLFNNLTVLLPLVIESPTVESFYSALIKNSNYEEVKEKQRKLNKLSKIFIISLLILLSSVFCLVFTPFLKTLDAPSRFFLFLGTVIFTTQGVFYLIENTPKEEERIRRKFSIGYNNIDFSIESAESIAEMLEQKTVSSKWFTDVKKIIEDNPKLVKLSREMEKRKVVDDDHLLYAIKYTILEIVSDAYSNMIKEKIMLEKKEERLQKELVLLEVEKIINE